MGIFTLLVGYCAGRTPAEADTKVVATSGELEKRSDELRKKDQALTDACSTLIAVRRHLQASAGGIQAQALPRVEVTRAEEAISHVDGFLARREGV